MGTIRLANFSVQPFAGWVRANTDTPPTCASGRMGTARFAVGQRTGLDTWAIDVHTSLRPGEVWTCDTDSATPEPHAIDPLPADPLAYFGLPTIAGVPLSVVHVSPDGAHYRIDLRARVGPMLVVELFLLWSPDCPGWAIGTLLVTASNPAVPDLVATVPPGFRLEFGSSLVTIPGLLWGCEIIPAGDTIADGQSRAYPLTIVWPRLVTPTDYSSAAALNQILTNGITSLYPGGNPRLRAGASALAWGREHVADAVASLHRWEPPRGLGVNPRSGDTGAQEDQVFVGAECMTPDGIGCDYVRYLTALAQSRRPCHHYEAGGEPLDLSRHPQLRFWDGRAHWHRGVSPDQLGKPRALTEQESQGWWGPDVEHWLLNTLAVASRITGDRALQRLLEAQARVYLLQWTAEPGLSTSSTYAARAVGWEGIGVVHLWRCLANRALAVAVHDRWLDRLDRVLLPKLSASDIWDIRQDDPRLGPGAWWMPWQQSVGAYGLDLAGQTFGRDDARQVALNGALRVLYAAWKLDGGTWLSAPSRTVSQAEPAQFDGSFNLFGMPLAPATILRHNPNHSTAKEIMAQLIRDAKGGHPWLPPEVLS